MKKQIDRLIEQAIRRGETVDQIVALLGVDRSRVQAAADAAHARVLAEQTHRADRKRRLGRGSWT